MVSTFRKNVAHYRGVSRGVATLNFRFKLRVFPLKNNQKTSTGELFELSAASFFKNFEKKI
jgi:hypothetical protein